MDDRQRSNQDLLAALAAALKQESALLATVLALLIDVEERRLHLELACSSMFDFCRRRLGLSEGEAFRRITAARLSKRFPQVLGAIRARRVHLSSVVALKDLFTTENVSALLDAVAGKSKREVEELVARLSPKPDARSMIRRLPEPESKATAQAQPGTRTSPPRLPPPVPPRPCSPASNPPFDARPSSPASNPSFDAGPVTPRDASFLPSDATRRHNVAGQSGDRHTVTPLGPSRHRVQLTVSSEARAKLERAQSLMRHRNVDGDLAVVVERALDLLIAKLEKERLGATTRSTARCASPRKEPFPTPSSSLPTSAAPSPSLPTSAAPSPSSSAAVVSGTTAPRTDALPSVTGVTAATRREVVRRDQERCSYVSPSGDRCPARDLLELDHRHPRALGGTNDATNLRLLCRAHNLYAAEQQFGRAHVAQAIRNRRRATKAHEPVQPSLPIPSN